MPLFIKTMLMIWSAILGILLGITHYPVTTFRFEKTVEIGRGNVLSMVWSADSERLLVNTNVGVWIYTDTLEDLAHLDQFFHADFSPDGQWLAGGDAENRVSLRDAESYVEKAKFYGHHAAIVQVAWHPTEANWLASVDEAGRVMVWDVATGRKIFNKKGLEFIDQVLWSHDGSYLALKGQSGELVVWEVLTGQVKFSLTGDPYHKPYNFKWADNSTLLLLWMEYADTEAWDIETNQPKNPGDFSYRDLPREAYYYALSPNGRYAAHTDSDNGWWRLELSDANSGEIFLSLLPHFSWQGPFGWSPDSTKIASAGSLGDLQVWDVEARLALGISHKHALVAAPIQWRSDDRMLMTATSLLYEGNVLIWDADTGRLLAELEQSQANSWGMTWQPNGTLLAGIGCSNYRVNCRQDRIYIWESEDFDGQAEPEPTYIIVPPYENLSETPLSNLVWHPDGNQLLFFANYVADAYIWHLNTNEFTKVSQSEVRTRHVDGWIFGFKEGVIPAKDTTVYIDWAGLYTYREADKYIAIHHLNEQTFSVSMQDDVSDVYLSETGRYVIARDKSDNWMIWETENGKTYLSQASYPFRQAAWNTDDRLLALLLSSGNTVIWDVELGQPLINLEGGRYYSWLDFPIPLAWSHDGSQIATVTDNILRIWDISLACEVHSFLDFIGDTLCSD